LAWTIQQLRVAPGDLIQRVAEHPLGGGIPVEDQTLGVGDDDSVVQVLDDHRLAAQRRDDGIARRARGGTALWRHERCTMGGARERRQPQRPASCAVTSAPTPAPTCSAALPSRTAISTVPALPQ